jgi:hypothetical protein
MAARTDEVQREGVAPGGVEIAPHPGQPLDDSGVDLTQVRASLARSPLERLRENEDGVRLLEALRRARRRA